ncbi:MAG: thiol-disulfide isomerase [Ignavibacteriae bacterium HGW-Ignavibacteriae-3]|nr:MAG: thiol-disulfide isomerase [Ignavibacteriae bacterium HGW-Ignavibacteriae-3]
MKKIVLLSALLLICLLNIVSAQTAPEKSERTKFDPARDPFSDVQTGVIEAQKSNKRILLDVGGEWCIWCHRLDGFFEANPELKNFMLENFVVIKVNWSPDNKNENFLSQYPKVAGYPHIFILESDGSFLYSKNTGELEKDKSYSAEKIMAFLKEWAPGKTRP